MYELRYATTGSGLGFAGSGRNYQRAYVVLGPGAPFLRVMPRGIRGLGERLDHQPWRPIEFPQDRSFSRAFWVEGGDEGAIRSYLEPGRRRFLLRHARGWRFNAGPEGVALLRRGRTPRGEWPRVALILERLATAVEAARW